MQSAGLSSENSHIPLLPFVKRDALATARAIDHLVRDPLSPEKLPPHPLALPETSTNALSAAAAAANRAGPPPCLMYEREDGQKEILRYAAMTADGRSINQLVLPMPDGTTIDYATRAAVDAWCSGQALTQAVMCPIGMHLFVDPVLAPDGNTYERHYLVDWLATHHTSPCTGESFLPEGAVAPQALRLTAHATMRAAAAWVLAHDPPRDIVDGEAEPLRDVPPLHVDVPIHVQAPPGRAVPMDDLNQVHLPAQFLQPLQMLRNRPGAARSPHRDWLHAMFCGTTLALYGGMLGMALVHDDTLKYLGCGLTFAAPLGAGACVLTARHFVNRLRRAQGLPLL